jgi:hypothetical protein
MRETDWCCEFHGICNWGGSFGYFDDQGSADLVVRLARALRPGGRLLVERPNRECVLRHFRREVETEKRISRNRWNRRHGRVEWLYGDWHGSPYLQSGQRLIVVGRKGRPAS